MKFSRSLSIISFATALVFFSSISQAGIHVKLQEGMHCGDLQGSWEGTGLAKMGPIKCHYDGDGTIFGYGSVFQATLSMKHTGAELCPDRDKLVLTGNCDDETGEISIHQQDVNMEGVIDENGTHIGMSGQIKVDGLKFDLSTDLHKLG